MQATRHETPTDDPTDQPTDQPTDRPSTDHDLERVEQLSLVEQAVPEDS